MGMLTKDDLRLIGEEVGKVIEDNILPALDTMIDEKMEKKLDPIRASIAALPTKDFVTEKIGELRGDMVAGFKKIDHRFDEMTDVLKDKHVFTASDAARIDAARLYPRPTA